jgi:hypothetical protein
VKSPPPLYTTEVGPDSSHGQGGAFLFCTVLFTALMLAACAPKWSPTPFDAQRFTTSTNFTGSEEELLSQAILARKNGDALGAIARLSTLEKRGADNPRVLYQLAIAFEEAEDFETAASVYMEVNAREPAAQLRRDASFRLALCLWELDKDKAAFRAIRALPENTRYSLQDRITFDLALGVAWIRVDRKRKGKAQTLGALVAAEGSEIAHWMRSMALFTLMELELQAASRQDFQVREKKQTLRLADRVAHIKAAEDLLRRVMQLNEVDWMLSGWLALGDAYALFANDLAQAPAPKKLTKSQKSAYTALLKEQAGTLRIKSAKAYEWGVEVATRSARQDHRSARLLISRLKAISQ